MSEQANLDALMERYIVLLRGRLFEEREEQLVAAAAVGISLVGAEVPLEDVGELHEQAASRLHEDFPEASPSEISAATLPPLMELLIQYSLAFRQSLEAHESAAAAARASEERYRQLFEDSLNGIVVLDGEGHVQMCNVAMSEMLGYSHDELVGMHSKDFQDVDEVELLERRRTARLNGEPVPADYRRRLVRRDGTVIEAESSVSVLGTVRQLSGVMVSYKDVTDRVESERALADSERRYRTVLHLASGGVFLLTESGRTVLANRSMCEMLGYTAEELVGMPVRQIVSEENYAIIRERLTSHVLGDPAPDRIEVSMIRKDGSQVLVDLSASAFEESSGEASLLVEARDITEERSLQRRVEEAAAEVASILEAVPSAIVLADETGTILRVNPAVVDVFGWEEDELLGQSVGLLASEPVTSEHRGYMRHYLETGRASTQHGLVVGRIKESSGRRKDGSTFPMEAGVEQLRQGGQRKFIAVLQDISDRKQAEQDRVLAQRAIVRSQFFATMSHELRTPLNSILGFGQLLAASRRDPLSEGQRAHVGDIVDAGEHLLTLINELLDIAKIDAGRQELHVDAIAPGALIEDVARSLEPLAQSRGLELRTSVADAPTEMVADERAFRQILMNLISNSIKFTETGQVEVRAHTAENELIVEVEDTGVGISDDSLERVFEEFAQIYSDPERSSEGTGLGLAITQRLVELHGGTVGVTSILGLGSTFKVRLPVAGPGEPGPADAATQTARSSSPSKGS